MEQLFTRVLKIAVFRCVRCGARYFSPPAVMVQSKKAPFTDRPERTAVTPPPEFVESIETDIPVAVVAVGPAKAPVSDKEWGRPSGRRHRTRD
jgi:hypothetical protein